MLSFSFTLETVLSNRRIATSMVMEKVTVMARMTMLTAMPTDILRFIFFPPLSDQQHHNHAAQHGKCKDPCQDQTAHAQDALAFFSFISPDGLL